MLLIQRKFTEGKVWLIKIKQDRALCLRHKTTDKGAFCLSLSYSGSNLAHCPVAKVILDLLKSTSPLHLIYYYIYEGQPRAFLVEYKKMLASHSGALKLHFKLSSVTFSSSACEMNFLSECDFKENVIFSINYLSENGVCLKSEPMNP